MCFSCTFAAAFRPSALSRVWLQHTQERFAFYCRKISASTASCTSRRMCCPTHCASYCASCQPLLRAFSGWIRSSLPRRSPGTAGSRRSRSRGQRQTGSRATSSLASRPERFRFGNLSEFPDPKTEYVENSSMAAAVSQVSRLTQPRQVISGN